MSAELTLPGEISGLLRRGSPVRIVKADGGRHVHVVTSVDYDPPLPAVIEAVACRWDRSVETAPPPHRTLSGWPAEEVALDLTDATGRAHAALWLREKYGGGATCAGPSWWFGEDRPSQGWRLSHPNGRVRDDGAGSLVAWPGDGRWPPFTPRHAALVAVPSLADLNPDDPRTLADGSSWVDAEALRRVVLHCARVSP